MYYNLVSDDRGKTLTLIFSDGSTTPVSTDHPRYGDILAAVIDGSVPEDEIREMADLVASVGDRLQGLSERVSVVGSTILFDGDPLKGAIADHILRLIREGDERGWKGLVNFLEKIQTNPNEHSRESLYSWISGRNFTITSDGDLIAYKGVNVNFEGVSESISRGTATVNGVVHKGAIPNPNGAVVEMPRSQVQHDTGVGCSTGLHAGTWEYASDFARGRVLTVRINPRDVVSVPTDCDAQKMRVSRYEVIDSTDTEIQGTTWLDEDYDEDPAEDDVEYLYCDECGEDFHPEDLGSDGICDECRDYIGQEEDVEGVEEDDSDPDLRPGTAIYQNFFGPWI